MAGAATLRRGLFQAVAGGRIPVDVSAEQTLEFPAEPRRVLAEDSANQVTSRRNPRCAFGYAFSPTGNSADLKLTPQL